jgi:hypothetical protein
MSDEANGGVPNGAEPRRGPSLRQALRLARVEAAEHSDVVIDLRQAEIARLEALRDALAPVFAEVPKEIDLFDVGLVPGERPRLFVDMVAFVEMGRDRRLYRFLRDGRHGRSVAAESEEIQPIVEAVTAYVARRLVERERLLSDEDWDKPAATPAPPAEPPAAAGENSPAVATKPRRFEAPAAKPRASGWLRALAVLFAFLLGGGLGAAVVVGLMVAANKGLLPGLSGG